MAHCRSVCKRHQYDTSPREKAKRAMASLSADNQRKTLWGTGVVLIGMGWLSWHIAEVCAKLLGLGWLARELIVMLTSLLEIKIGACSSIKWKPFSNNKNNKIILLAVAHHRRVCQLLELELISVGLFVMMGSPKTKNGAYGSGKTTKLIETKTKQQNNTPDLAFGTLNAKEIGTFSKPYIDCRGVMGHV